MTWQRVKAIDVRRGDIVFLSGDVLGVVADAPPASGSKAFLLTPARVVSTMGGVTYEFTPSHRSPDRAEQFGEGQYVWQWQED